jgi:hypothetical protein
MMGDEQRKETGQMIGIWEAKEVAPRRADEHRREERVKLQKDATSEMRVGRWRERWEARDKR